MLANIRLNRILMHVLWATICRIVITDLSNAVTNIIAVHMIPRLSLIISVLQISAIWRRRVKMSRRNRSTVVQRGQSAKGETIGPVNCEMLANTSSSRRKRGKDSRYIRVLWTENSRGKSQADFAVSRLHTACPFSSIRSGGGRHGRTFVYRSIVKRRLWWTKALLFATLKRNPHSAWITVPSNLD